MNYFTHGRSFSDDPYFLAGTAVPDWLSVADRGLRVRKKHAAAFVEDPDIRVARVAQGIVQHHADDGWFHTTRAFAELSLGISAAVRDYCPGDEGFRPSFLGHVLVEILLDWALIEDDPAGLHAYYRTMSAIDPAVVQAAVNRMAPRPTDRLAEFIELFCRERFLWDYAEDVRLLVRLNQVMRRVRLPHLAEPFCGLLAKVRPWVRGRSEELLRAG